MLASGAAGMSDGVMTPGKNIANLKRCCSLLAQRSLKMHCEETAHRDLKKKSAGQLSWYAACGVSRVARRTTLHLASEENTTYCIRRTSYNIAVRRRALDLHRVVKVTN